ncbi:MAG: hypothetical protein ACHQ2Z_15700 [Elusimicrobiota bacterium]
MRQLTMTGVVRLLRERPLAVLLCLSTALCALNWSLFSGATPLGCYNDDAHYYLAAAGIARYGRFVDLCLPEHPARFGYAVGYPLLIAPLVKLFPASTAPIAFFHFCAFAASAGLVAFLAYRMLSLTDAILAVFCWFFCVLPSSMPGAFMSDIPFLVFSLTPFALLEGAEIGHAAAFGIAFCAALAVLIRPLGIFLIPALGVQIWAKRSNAEALKVVVWAAAALAAASAASVVFFGYHGLLELFVPAPLLSGLSSAGIAPDFPGWTYLKTVIAGNAVFYADALFSVLVVPGRPVFQSPLLLPLLWALRLLWLSSFAAGFWVRFRRRDGLAVFSALYAGFLALWFLVDIRYLLPLRPALVLLTFVGFEYWIGRWPRARTLKYVFLAAVLYLGAADIWIQARDAAGSVDEPKYAWINEHLEADARIADEIDGTLFLRTNRYAYEYPFDSRRSGREIIDSMIAAGVRYYVLYPTMLSVQPGDAQIDEGWHQRQRRSIEEEVRGSARFEPIFESNSSVIYRLRGSPSPPTRRTSRPARTDP